MAHARGRLVQVWESGSGSADDRQLVGSPPRPPKLYIYTSTVGRVGGGVRKVGKQESARCMCVCVYGVLWVPHAIAWLSGYGTAQFRDITIADLTDHFGELRLPLGPNIRRFGAQKDCSCTHFGLLWAWVLRGTIGSGCPNMAQKNPLLCSSLQSPKGAKTKSNTE